MLIYAMLCTHTTAAIAETAAGKDPEGRFQPYEPNYAIGQWTKNDDFALEARYSFKYLLSRPASELGKSLQTSRNEWYVKFTGEFDFYWGSRFSAPVINRVSNPGLHLRKYIDTDKKFLGMNWKYVDFGLQHLSNGQTQDPTLLRGGVTRPQAVYERDPHDPFFDRISRSVNFVSIEASFRFGDSKVSDKSNDRLCPGLAGCYNLWARLIPYHFDNDNPVTWGPEELRTSRISDYDRLRVVLSKSTNISTRNGQRKSSGFNEIEFGIEWTVGDQLLDTDSFDVFVFLPYETGRDWRIPFYLRYHNGPLNNFSNYTKKQDSIGIGIRVY